MTQAALVKIYLKDVIVLLIIFDSSFYILPEI